MRARGFTLIEVMVALLVIALGIGALLTTLVSSAGNVAYLRDRSFAQWIAFNRLAELRLSTSRPAATTDGDTVEYAGVNWGREWTISEAGIGDLLRVDVRVTRLGPVGAPAPANAARASVLDEEEAPKSSLGRAVGFIGPSLSRASGISPDWSPAAPAGPGPGGGGDGGGDGDGDGDGEGGGDGGGDGDRTGEGGGPGGGERQ